MKTRTVFDFTENEYKQWAQNKNFSAFANIMSGLNFSANKIMYTIFSKNITSFQKVENIANMTALETEYPGGASNLEGVIYSNIQDYVTGTNLPIIQGKGDTGKRLNTMPAAARYNFVRIGENFSKLLNKDDLKVVPRYFYEGKYIEYQFLPFNLPLILINGSEGIGSGHAQKILPRNEENIKEAVICKLTNKKYNKDLLKPHYNNYKGTIEYGENENQYIITGALKRISSTKTEIFEVTPNYNYKSLIVVLDKLQESGKIKSYDDLCDPKTDTFNIVIKHSDFSKMTDEELLKLFKQYTTITENLTVIDEFNRVKLFESAEEILDHYMRVKLDFIGLRKGNQINEMQEGLLKDLSKYLFIKNVTEGLIKVNNMSKADIVAQLDTFEQIKKIEDSYDYLLRMPIYSLTAEKMQELLDSIKASKAELETLKSTPVETLWLNELK